jgi:hypothetical protein
MIPRCFFLPPALLAVRLSAMALLLLLVACGGETSTPVAAPSPTAPPPDAAPASPPNADMPRDDTPDRGAPDQAAPDQTAPGDTTASDVAEPTSVSLRLNGEEFRKLEFSSLKTPIPLAALLPKTPKPLPPSSWRTVRTHARNRETWRVYEPSQRRADQVPCVLLNSAGRAALAFYYVGDDGTPRLDAKPAIQLDDLVWIEVVTELPTEGPGAPRKLPPLKLVVRTGDGSERTLGAKDLNALPTVGGGGLGGGAPAPTGRPPRRAWRMVDVLGESLTSAKDQTLLILGAGERELRVPVSELTSNPEQHLLRLNRRGYLIYRKVVEGKREAEVRVVQVLQLRAP